MCIHFLEDIYERKVVIITGGSSGMGKGMATRFAKEGHELLLQDVQRKTRGNKIGN